MIPKKIHYIWLGGRPKSKLTEICINSWKRKLPDYTIIEWNEQNINLEELCKENRFLKKCVELELWAFVSDYIRLYILYTEGGIYLDTDVEVVKTYDDLLCNSSFMGYEENDYIGTATIGSERHNPLIKAILDFYNTDIWNVSFINNPIIFKCILEKEPELFNDCRICPIDYFSPYNPRNVTDRAVETSNTYSIHWYTQNWNMSLKGYIFIKTKHIRNPIKHKVVAFRALASYMKHKYIK